jgi:hypothetical protein
MGTINDVRRRRGPQFDQHSPTCEASAQAKDTSLQDPASLRPLTTTITLAWTAPSFAAVKRIIAPRDCRSGQQKASWIGGTWSSLGLPGSSRSGSRFRNVEAGHPDVKIPIWGMAGNSLLVSINSV